MQVEQGARELRTAVLRGEECLGGDQARADGAAPAGDVLGGGAEVDGKVLVPGGAGDGSGLDVVGVQEADIRFFGLVII